MPNLQVLASAIAEIEGSHQNLDEQKINKTACLDNYCP